MIGNSAGSGEPRIWQYAQASGFAQIFQAAGNMIIFETQAPYRLSMWPSRTPQLSLASARSQPSRLLRAGYAVVNFTGRAAELDDLVAWRDDRSRTGVAVRLIHGSGGQGKTRLAGHVARLWQQEGWVVLTAHHRRDRSGPVALPAPDLSRAAGVLIVADYAERWTISDLLSLLADVRAGTGLQVLVLLLSRSAGTWWQSLRYRIRHDLDIDADARELGPLASQPSDRATLFTSARDRFAELLQASVPQAASVPTVLAANEAYNLVLAVHMAALAVVLAYDCGAAPPVDPVEVSAFLLARERDYWNAIHGRAELPLPTTPVEMTQAVYTAILTGPLRYKDGVTALQLIGVESSQHPGRILRDHATCYPPPRIPEEAEDSADEAPVLEPLYPDRLGEDFLALTTPGHVHDYPSDPWAAGAVTRLLAPALGQLNDETQEPVWTRHALTVLIETSRRWRHVADRQLYPLLREQPRLALTIGGAALSELAELPSIDIPLLEAIDACLPRYRHVDLDIGIAVVTSRLAEHRLANTDDPAVQARVHDQLGIRLFYAGLHNQALAAGNRAVQIYRRLAAANPAGFDSLLAGSLSNLGAWLEVLNRHEDALAATEEAVQIRRRLGANDPEVSAPDLARSLTNLGGQLAGVGRREEGLAATEEAVQIYRRLAAANPGTFERSLAASLTNLGSRLAGVGRREGLAATEEAVQIYRRLAAANPAAFDPDLAASLSSLGSGLGRQGRHEEALAATEQAVEIYRRLAAANPAAFEPGLAGALSTTGTVLSVLGQREEALAATEQAVEIYRRLAAANPAAFGADLASSLSSLGAGLSDMGRCEEALAVTEQAVEIYRRLAAANPATVPGGLARSLTNLGFRLGEMGRRNEALAATEEAVEIYRRLAAANPAAFESDLAGSLSNLGAWLGELQRFEKALTVTGEAVEIYRRLAAANPAAFDPDLARSLLNLGAGLSITDRREEGLAAVEQAVQVYRRLATAKPDAFEPSLATSLSNLGVLLAVSGRRDEALGVTQQAVQIHRRLAAANPDAFEPDFAASLKNLGARLAEIGRREEALVATEQAVQVYRRIAAANPGRFLTDLADSLASLTELANDNDGTAYARSSWLEAIAGLDESSSRGELRAHFARNLAAQSDYSAAVGQLEIAAADATRGEPRQLARARQTIRAAVTQIRAAGHGLPSWATQPIRDKDRDLVNQWAQQRDWPEVEAFLRRHVNMLTGEEFRTSLAVLTALYPGDPSLATLASLLAEIDAKGFDAVLAQKRAVYDRVQLINSWIATPTWHDSARYFAEHQAELVTPEVCALLESVDDEIASQHLAIIRLTSHLPSKRVYDIVTVSSVATKEAFKCVEAGDVQHLRLILAAAPKLVSMPLFVLAAGEVDQARQLAKRIADRATLKEREDHALLLRAYARVFLPDPANANALADIIYPSSQRQ